MSVAPVSGADPKSQYGSPDDALRGLDMSQFLSLMIAELQNQDPLSPMENKEILEQISQIREIGATQGLTDTLDAILSGQNLSSASAMIGKTVKGLDAKGDALTGVVDRVTITGGKPVLHLGTNTIPLANVQEILPTSASE